MDKFDITRIIDRYQPDCNELAKVLFPGAKYPRQAFARVIKGEAQLDSDQLEKLAAYLGIMVADLFAGSAWSSFNEDGCMCFKKGKYKAKLNYNGAYLTLYSDNNVVEQRIGDMSSMKVQDFFEYLDKLIKIHESKN